MLLVVAFLLLGIGPGCNNSNKLAEPTAAPGRAFPESKIRSASDVSAGKPEQAEHVATFATQSGEIPVNLEVVATPQSRAMGLMHRKELPPYGGMLFIFPNDADHVFWMKNTYIPLDLIFVDNAHTVVGIVADAEPLTESARSAGVKSRMVIEVNGGFAARHGIQVGDRVYFRPTLPRVMR